MAKVRISRLWGIYVTFLFPLLPFWPRWGQGSPIVAPEMAESRRGSMDSLLLEQHEDLDMQSFLETLRGQFLRTFNLSGMGPPLQPRGSRVEPPEYMLELYNRFASDHTAMPSANIIRSFKNEDSSPDSVGLGGVRRHPLLFNVSIPHHERVTAAQLRLYTLVQRDRRLYAGVDRKVTIFEVRGKQQEAEGHMKESEGLGEDEEGEPVRWVELASRQVYGTDSGWESFDLTAAVRQWHKSEYSTTHRLEVHIASLNTLGEVGHFVSREDAEGGMLGGDMDIDMSPEAKHKPLLIVFSDDQSGDHRGDKRELNEMIEHENLGVGVEENLELGLNELWGDQHGASEEEEEDEEALIQMRSNLIYDTASRIRRNAKGSQCKRTSLYVEFKDIGWDSWILAPTGYEAYECSGTCSYPLTKHVTPTKHAIVQTLVNLKSPQKVSRACCVPTKLDPISLLYLDDTGVVTYKYKYDGMVVAECGCR
ncbi:bone morphogenetic protein 10 [Paramormyrops kingsleyae]|uniref:Bone morphogenetic protein 10 n=1 Tax=Paramormyrops kingsleyae TaxID=1676925 RepID=A0A3B3RC69_9TELE|nr:bone morphogenetic protein 10 [Paramormyrops kingsleyae]